MISEAYITELAEKSIEGTNKFLVDVSVRAGNDIRILVDSVEGVSIDECVELSRGINAVLDEQDENFSLEVSSPGLGEPLKLMQQYEKNIGRAVEVILKDGSKRKGVLLAVQDNSITVEVEEKVKSPGKKGKKRVIVSKLVMEYENIKSTKVVVSL